MIKWAWILPPVLVFGLLIATAAPGMAASPGIKSVVAGYGCSYAVMGDGTLWAWGDNEYGLPGDRTTVNRSTAVQVPIEGVKAVACGYNFTILLKNDGTVWGWGENRYGQLGDGTNVSRPAPEEIPGLSGVKAIAASDSHAMALMEDGTVMDWGAGTYNYVMASPVSVDIADVTAIGCGNGFGVALKADGTVWSWQYEGTVGGILYKFSPAQVPISNVTAISCGGMSTLALKNDGTVWGWGDNGAYRLGNVTEYEDQQTPVQAERLTNVTQIVCGGVSVALTGDERTFVWGGSSTGELGDGHYGTEVVEAPEPMQNMTGIKMISAGSGHCLALKYDGTVWAWGENDMGQLGNGVNGSTYNLTFYYNNGTLMDCPFASDFYQEPSPVQIFIGDRQNASASYHTTRLPVQAQAMLAVPDDTPRPANVSLTAGGGWGVALGNPIQYITQDNNGNLYVFSGNDVSYIDRDGTVKWNLAVPDQWTICQSWYRISAFCGEGEYTAGCSPRPVYSMSNGMLYLYAVPNMTYTALPGWYESDTGAASNGNTWAVMAISPEGKIAWTYTLDASVKKFDDTFIGSSGDRVYVFHGYTETVLDSNGKKLLDIGNVAVPAAVDKAGNIYVVDAVEHQCGAAWTGGGYADIRIPGRIVMAYGHDGSPLWQKDVGDYVQWNYVEEDLRPAYGTTPIYQNGTLYVPVRSGIVALDTDGNVKWSRTMESGSYQLFPIMPIDSDGNVYLENQLSDSFDFTNDVYVISNDGRNVSAPRKYVASIEDIDTIAGGGIIYDVSWDPYGDWHGWPTGLGNLTMFTVRAYDIVNDSVLWAYTIPSDKMNSVVIDHDDLYSLFGGTMDEWLLRDIDAGVPGVQQHTMPIEADNRISMYLDGSTLYVVAHAANYQSPIVLGQSKYVYTSGIYVIDTNGSVACEQPLSGVVTAAMVNNSTVFFGTGGGGLSAVTIGAVAGLAILAAACLFAKFIVFGTVTRARSRLDKNENRNRVLGYINGHPGSTLHELSRGMRMNMGTVRYHVFILAHNHRVTTFKEGKFIRYFPNSNFYSKEEQLVISLMRREPIKNTLKFLTERPGISTLEFSKEFGQSTTATYYTMNELLYLGIVEKGPSSGRGCAYYIKEGYLELVKKMTDRI